MLKRLCFLVLALFCKSIVFAEKPNIVFILADDLGWKDTHAYGSTYYQTPNIDKLAGQGMRFTDAYSASPLCSPSRAAILTGQYPQRYGMTVASGHYKEVRLENRRGQSIKIKSGISLGPANCAGSALC